MAIKFGEIKFIIIFSILIIFTGIVILYINSNYFSGDDFTDTSQLNATRFTPVLEAKITTGENLIYSSTFQMAWNNLCKDTLKGETVEVENPPNYIKILNNKIYEPSSISESSCVATSGTMKEDISDKIELTMAEKFGYIIKLKKVLKKDGIQVFAFLDKNIKLEGNKVIEKYVNNIYFGTEPVDILYTRFKQYPQNYNIAELLYYKDHGCSGPYGTKGYITFTFKLHTTSKEDELIFSTIPPENTLKETYEKIVSYSNKFLTENTYECPTTYAIPELNFKLKNAFSELSNKKISNNSFADYEIIDSKQAVSFKFVEGKNTHPWRSSYGGTNNGDRCCVIYSPFIIYIRNKSSDYPSFMAYIANAELLSKKDCQEFLNERNKEDGVENNQ